MCELKVFYWDDLISVMQYQKGCVSAIAVTKEQAIKNIIGDTSKLDDYNKRVFKELLEELNREEPDVLELKDYVHLEYGSA